MNSVRRKEIRHCFVIIFLLSLLIIPAVLFGEEADKKPEGKPDSRTDFVLTIKDDLISLSAKDASLKEVVEEIGKRMKIKVVANIPEEEKVTTEFDRLSLEDALKRLSRNYVYEKESEKGKITKIMFLQRGKGTALSEPATKEFEVEKGKGLIKPESRIKEEVAGKKPEAEEVDKEKPPRPEPFKFEFDPSEFMKEGR